MEVTDIIKRTEEILKDIKEYILANPDWIFYFIPTSSNPKVNEMGEAFKEFILEHPNDWEEWVDLEVTGFNGVTAKVYVTLDDESDFPPKYEKYILLTTLYQNAEFNKKAMMGEFNEIRIKELNNVISYHEEELKKAKEELEKIQSKTEK